jgi:hypothetical protein
LFGVWQCWDCSDTFYTGSPFLGGVANLFGMRQVLLQPGPAMIAGTLTGAAINSPGSYFTGTFISPRFVNNNSAQYPTFPQIMLAGTPTYDTTWILNIQLIGVPPNTYGLFNLPYQADFTWEYSSNYGGSATELPAYQIYDYVNNIWQDGFTVTGGSGPIVFELFAQYIQGSVRGVYPQLSNFSSVVTVYEIGNLYGS